MSEHNSDCADEGGKKTVETSPAEAPLSERIDLVVDADRHGLRDPERPEVGQHSTCATGSMMDPPDDGHTEPVGQVGTLEKLNPLDPVWGGWWPPDNEPQPLSGGHGSMAKQVRALIVQIRTLGASLDGPLDDAPCRGLGVLAAFADSAGAALDPRTLLSELQSLPRAELVAAFADAATRDLARQCLAVAKALPAMSRAVGELSKDLLSRSSTLRLGCDEGQQVAGLPVPIDSYELPPGWRVHPNGGLHEVRKTVEGEQVLVRVAESPVFVVGVAEDPAMGTCFVDVLWLDPITGKPRQATVERLVVADSRRLVELAAQRAPVTSSNARKLVDFLSRCEHLNAAVLPSRTLVRRMGWANLPGGERAFVLGKDRLGGAADAIELRPMEGAAPLLEGWQVRGSRAAWEATVRPVVEAHPVPGVLYLAALASPLLALLGRPSFVVDLACPTGHGKSTALGVACSAWGDPRPGAGVFHTWNGTGVALERFAALCGHLPLCLDETKLSGGRRADELYRVVYTLSAGQGRGRGKPDGLRTLDRWALVALSTGEAPLVAASNDAGTRARVLSLTQLPFGSQSEEGRRLTEQTEGVLRRHHGHAGRVLIEHLLTADPAALAARYDVLRESLAPRFAPGTATRLAAHAAVLLLAGELAQTLSLPCPDLHAAETVLTEAIQLGAADADRPRAALVDLVSHLTACPARVIGLHGDTASPPTAGWLGKIDTPTATKAGRYCVVKTEAEAFLEQRRHRVPDCVAAWAQRGWLHGQGRGRVRTVQVNGNGLSCYVFPQHVIDAVRADPLGLGDAP